ncbi:hypothetical protein AA0111_g12773 [Alternaria arborescens]|uniref:hypothetical protein n=1 Tax=Alternaria arborescens TaxID=156630 RepID=UPI0010754E7B|nr:hypothetical protein AA0111_g12773 [Alternaria arborescens]RYO11541.1 hypothetical protein AA0111_g12773 [Alternaria arborescens]
MADFTDAPAPHGRLRKDGHEANPRMSRRGSVCGHPGEFIGLWKIESKNQRHSAIGFESFQEHGRAENCAVDIEARCLDCATERKDMGDKDQTVPPQRTLESHQAGTYAGETGTTSPGGLDDVLKRHTCSRHQGTVTKPYPPVFEEKHQAHCLEVEAETGTCPDKWLAIPTTRPWNTTPHTAGHMGLGGYQRSVSALSGNEACHPTTDSPAPFAGVSAFIDHLIAEYASPVNSGCDPDPVDTKYEQPRAAPAVPTVPTVPKRDLLDSTTLWSSISTGALTKSGPVSRNFRRLRLDIQSSHPSIHRTQSGQESPDWACQTSRAIEAGRISMDSICMRTQDSTPRHILEAMRSPTETCLPDRRRVQSFGPGREESNYSAPFSRHSEGALQLVRGANAARRVREPGGMEGRIGREPLRHDCVQVALPIDLNKSLPALPLQICRQHGKEQAAPR